MVSRAVASDFSKAFRTSTSLSSSVLSPLLAPASLPAEMIRMIDSVVGDLREIRKTKSDAYIFGKREEVSRVLKTS